MAQTTSLVFNGGSIPSPAPVPTGSGKAKLLKIGEITITEQGAQVTKKVICDPDSVTTVAPFMEVLTSAKLAELVEANSIIVLDDGDMQYLMANANITVEEGISVCTAVNFLGLSQDKRAKVAYNCTRITDELTLQQVVEVGEPVETDFNLVIADSEDIAPNTLIDKMEVVSNEREPDEPTILQLETTVDGQGNRKVAINEDNLRTFVAEVDDAFEDVWDAIGELPNDEHGYFNSSLVTTPGDGTTTSIVIDNFRISQGRDVHGDNIEFVPTHQEDGVDFGEVYLNPGTYILNVHYTLQWVGNPRGTFLPLIANVGEQPFDFSYEHEDILRSTRIVTRTTRGKFGLNFPFDADTPPMGIWVKYLEIAQIASYNHPAVTHDSTLAGSGQIGDPLGVTPAAFGKVKDIPTSISQFRTGDVIPVDGPNGPAKMEAEKLLELTAENALAGNVAPEFVPNSTSTIAYQPYMYNGLLYVAKESYQGPWDDSKFEKISVLDLLKKIVDDIARSFPEEGSVFGKNSFCIRGFKLYRFTEDHSGAWTGTDVRKADISEFIEEFSEKLKDIIYNYTSLNSEEIFITDDFGNFVFSLMKERLKCHKILVFNGVEYEELVPGGTIGNRNASFDSLVVVDSEYKYLASIDDDGIHSKNFFKRADFNGGDEPIGGNTEDVEIVVPSKFVAVVGDTLQLFFRGMFKAPNPYVWALNAECVLGKNTPRYYQLKPSAGQVGSTALKIHAKTKNGMVVGTATTSLKIVAQPSSPVSAKKILCFGDSLTAYGDWPAEAYRRLTGTGGAPEGLGLTNIDFCGRQTRNGAGYCGVGGWTWHSYTTHGTRAIRFQVTGVSTLSYGAVYTNDGNKYTILENNTTGGSGNILCGVDAGSSYVPDSTMTLTKSSGSGDSTITYTSYSEDSQNPLWDYGEGKMTFVPYADEYSEGKIDYVYTLLTWNGLSGYMTDFTSIMNQVKVFADTLHSDFPSAKLKIMGLQIPSVNGGVGANYGATGSYYDWYGLAVTAFNLSKAYKEFAESADYSSFVEFVNVAAEFDSEYNMPNSETAVNTRNSQIEVVGTNGVHPSTSGYMQIADVVYRSLCEELNN